MTQSRPDGAEKAAAFIIPVDGVVSLAVFPSVSNDTVPFFDGKEPKRLQLLSCQRVVWRHWLFVLLPAMRQSRPLMALEP